MDLNWHLCRVGCPTRIVSRRILCRSYRRNYMFFVRFIIFYNTRNPTLGELFYVFSWLFCYLEGLHPDVCARCIDPVPVGHGLAQVSSLPYLTNNAPQAPSFRCGSRRVAVWRPKKALPWRSEQENIIRICRSAFKPTR